MVAAARPVGVEVPRLDAVVDQPLTGRARLLDRSGRGDVVGGDAVAEHREHPRTLDRLDRRRLDLHPLEERRLADIGRVGPGVAIALGRLQLAPAFVAREHVGVGALEHLLAHRVGDRLLDLLRARPDVGEVDRARRRSPRRAARWQVDVHPPGERVGDAERRRSEVVVADVLVDPALEVAVAREHRADDEVVFVDRLRDLLGQRAGVADAGRAAVADQVEAELVEVLVEARRARGSR